MDFLLEKIVVLLVLEEHIGEVCKESLYVYL